MVMPENAAFFVDDVCIPHSWYTIEPGVNDRFYVYITDVPAYPNATPTLGYIAVLESRVYTGTDLAAEIQTALNGIPLTQANPFTASYSATTHKISISTTANDLAFKVLTGEDLKSQMDGAWPGPTYNTAKPDDINSPMLKQSEGASSLYQLGAPWISGVLSLQPIRSLYLYSPTLGNFETIGPNGERSILKAIPVTAGPNYMIFDNTMAGNDYLDCSRQSLRTLEFQLKDVHGNLVNFHGSNLSFSLIFDVLPEK